MKLTREEWIDCAENPEFDEFNQDDERKKPMYGGDKEKEGGGGSGKAVVTIEIEVEKEKLKKLFKAIADVQDGENEGEDK